MVQAVTIDSPEAQVLAALRIASQEAMVPQLYGLVAFNVPALNLEATSGEVNVAFRQLSPISVTQASTMAVARGRIYNPKLKAWAFNLDSHTFYVLKLADDKTLLYDLLTQQWSWWASPDVNYLRTTLGMNWKTSGSNAFDHGSNIVAGDDTYGILWMLNPEQGYDESPRYQTPMPFQRVVTGQIVGKGRMTIPAYQTYLTGNNGEPAYDLAPVTLSYSDDAGKSFVSAGTLTVETGNYEQEFAWRSLGLIKAPGRLYRIEDDGAFAQINDLTVYDGSTS